MLMPLPKSKVGSIDFIPDMRTFAFAIVGETFLL